MTPHEFAVKIKNDAIADFQEESKLSNSFLIWIY